LKENFDRFNFAIYKEKEIADFRRWFTALAVMALFVGLASAQVGSTTPGSGFSPFTCSVSNVTVTPNLRSEGLTEETGDIVLVCTGGTPLPIGSQVPTVSIQVFYNVGAVTSRLISSSSSVNASEAILLIDEPDNNGAQAEGGYGPTLPQIICGNVAGISTAQAAQNGAGPNGCPESVGNSTYGGLGVPVNGSYPANGTTPAAPGANVFQGVVSGASVSFNGIPVLPPVSSGLARVYRITNVRVAANGFLNSFGSGVGQINASISVSPAGSMPIQNPNPIVGYVNLGMKGSVANAANFNQCNASTGFGSLLNFVEQFPTAFKTRVDGLRGIGGSGANGNVNPAIGQNTPGQPYNSESNFIMNGTNEGANSTLSLNGFTAGLADYGTRLKAVFTNVPAGATVYVSTTNVTNSSGANGINAVAAPNSTTTATSFAELLISETAPDGTTSAAAVPVASFTNSFIGSSSSGNPSSYLNYVALTSQGASTPVVAVWEVVNTQPTFIETFTFSVFFGYSNVTSTYPPSGASQVNLSLAPNPTNNAFSASSGGTTAVNNLIPRFLDDSGTGSGVFTINLCSTTLLFPYVTTLTGFTTGISIANTTVDPFKTVNQSGTCTFNWFNDGVNPAPTTSVIIGPVSTANPNGPLLVFDAAGASPGIGSGFSGFMFAVCNFQLAHGTAIVTDLGSQHILATYLALVLPTGTSARNNPSAPEQLNN